MIYKHDLLAAVAAGTPAAVSSLNSIVTGEAQPAAELIPIVDLKAGPLLVTVKDAGKILSVSKSQIFLMLKAGMLERRKIGGATRVTMASLRKVAGG